MGSSCCGPNASPPEARVEVDVTRNSSSQSSAALSEVRGEDGIHHPRMNKMNADSGDCDDLGDAAPETSCEDDFRGSDAVHAKPDQSNSVSSAKASKNESNVSSGNVFSNGHSSTLEPDHSTTSNEPDRPDCCRGKLSPCCDESCLDRLALRECEMGSNSPCTEATGNSFSSASTSADGATLKRGACDRHRRSVWKQYAARLAALGCICRALLALGQESCCEARERSLLNREKRSERTLEQTLPSASVDSCCASRRSPAQSSAQSTGRGRKPRSAYAVEKHSSKGCSGGSCCKPKTTNPPADCAGSCASGDASCAGRRKASSEDDACADACCTSRNQPVVEVEKSGPVGIARDPEGQAIGVDHVVLSVSGMTCTGCETKLHRTLATVAAVQNLKTSLILSRAEFDVDLSLSTVDSVVKHLERTTEFKSEIITSHGSSMDIIVSGDPLLFINRAWPEGVMDLSLIGENTVRVAFDPEVVGARDLTEKHWRGLVKLAPFSGDPALAAGRNHVRHVGYMTLLSAVLTIPVLVMAWAPLPEQEIAYGSASLALATIVQVVIAGPFYPKALKALVFSRVIEMDLLIVLSTSAAYIFSVVSFGYLVAGKPLSTGQFFATSTLLVTLIMLGRYVAALARQKAVASISIRSFQSQTALLVEKCDSSEAQEIDVRLLQYGDNFRVLPDMRIPTDGTVVSGSSEVNESMLTGESRPVEKNPKSRVIAGTINGSGTLVVRLTRLPGDNTINAVATMVDEAKLCKPKMQEIADRVASYFVPVIVGLTIITLVIWVAVGIAVQGKTGSEATVQSITYAITLLIVSCPCGIGLAVPMVVVIASGIAAERGVIFKSANAIEVAHKASHVVFDKTGTLTEGKLCVTIERYLGNEERCLSLLLGLISDSKHPVSVAVRDHLRRKGVVAKSVSGAKSLTGRGMEVKFADQKLQAGNSRWLKLCTHPLVQPMLSQGYTAFCFTIDGAPCAVFALEDSLRDDAAHTVTSLQTRGVSVHVVSGDDDGAVQGVATKLGIAASNVRARSSPADKQAYIKGLLGDCSNARKPIVIFCGDGTNDAVALAQATIGVHMNEGSDVAESAADVVLMRSDLSGLLTAVDASKLAMRRIKFNFAWSFVYNTFAVLLAAGAFVDARIPPEFAGLGELVSVLPVIAAAVLLRWSSV